MRHMLYTDICYICNETFSEQNPCCCDDGYSFDEGPTKQHVDGMCKKCCFHQHNGNNRDNGIGVYERGE